VEKQRGNRLVTSRLNVRLIEMQASTMEMYHDVHPRKNDPSPEASLALVDDECDSNFYSTKKLFGEEMVQMKNDFDYSE
jgi:hypothetical protein